MRAAVAREVNARWELKDMPDPQPGPGQVLIKIHASGLCYTDVHQTQGHLPVNFPIVLGHEPVGEVVGLGVGVTSRRIGDRVGVPWVQQTCGRCEWCSRGKSLFCADQLGTSAQLNGGHAEYMTAYADATLLIPDGLAYEEAAPIFCAGYTVYSGLRMAKPQPHERVAVLGIGGLGHLGIQYAHAAGFETFAITHSEDKINLALGLGADHVVDGGKELMKAGGADVILATSNSYKSTAEALHGLRPDGRLIVMGLSSEKLEIDPGQLLMKRAHIIGSLQNDREYLYEALDYVARGKVKVIAETFKLSDINKAFEKVESGKVRFRAVITA